MSQQSCSACNDLREYAPEFVINGVTDSACENLANDDGLSGADGHTDCDDLHDINDCLIGNMDDEVDSFDVCEWKDFMHQYIPNNYETLKALICSTCGQWEMLHDLCSLLGHIISPPVLTYGVIPKAHPERRVGTIPSKSGTPNLIAQTNPHPSGSEQYIAFDGNQSAGIAYAKEEITNCESGQCEVFEWIYPSIYLYDISPNVELGDVLWYAGKEEWQSITGWTDYLWHVFDLYSYTWHEVPIVSGTYSGKSAHLQITCNPGGIGDNYIGVVLTGTSYPSQAPGVRSAITPPTAAERLYRHSC